MDDGRHSSFEPIIGEHLKILILGSLPGRKSLEEQQYYAHPNNAFWKIWSELLSFDREHPYHRRLDIFKQSKIGLWDVCRSAVRPGSLDSSIKKEEVNDIRGLIGCHPELSVIAFNGKKPASLFARHIGEVGVNTITMLSTSPANASFSYDRKLEDWERLMEYLL